MESDDLNEMLEEEMGALEAILMEDVTVIRDDNGLLTSAEVMIAPATAQNVSEQHVKCTLVAKFPPTYPMEQPHIVIRNPRGIDENVLADIELEIKKKCEECQGNPVIYELTEVVRDHLTDNNTPSCPCAICLYHFNDSDSFTKTQCFHYFHKHCLGRYVSNCEETYAASIAEQKLAPWQQQNDLTLLCPVCRETITVEDTARTLLSYPPHEEEGEEEEVWRPDAPEVKALREKMAALFLKQKSNGGIINLEEEKNKYLVNLTQDDNPIAVIEEEISPTSQVERVEIAPPNLPKEAPPPPKESFPRYEAAPSGEGSSKRGRSWGRYNRGRGYGRGRPSNEYARRGGRGTVHSFSKTNEEEKDNAEEKKANGVEEKSFKGRGGYKRGGKFKSYRGGSAREANERKFCSTNES